MWKTIFTKGFPAKQKTRVRDSKGVRKEKEKGREKEWESVPWERDCFPIFFFFFGKKPIENKPYFY